MSQSVFDAIARCNPDEPLEPHDERRVDLDDVRGTAIQRSLSCIRQRLGPLGFIEDLLPAAV